MPIRNEENYKKPQGKPHKDWRINLKASQDFLEKYNPVFDIFVKYKFPVEPQFEAPNRMIEFYSVSSATLFAVVSLHDNTEEVKNNLETVYRSLMNSFGLKDRLTMEWEDFVEAAGEIIDKYKACYIKPEPTVQSLLDKTLTRSETPKEEGVLISYIITHGLYVDLPFELVAKNIGSSFNVPYIENYTLEGGKCPRCGGNVGIIFKEKNGRYSWFCAERDCLKKDAEDSAKKKKLDK